MSRQSSRFYPRTRHPGQPEVSSVLFCFFPNSFSFAGMNASMTTLALPGSLLTGWTVTCCIFSNTRPYRRVNDGDKPKCEEYGRMVLFLAVVPPEHRRPGGETRFKGSRTLSQLKLRPIVYFSWFIEATRACSRIIHDVFSPFVFL